MSLKRILGIALASRMAGRGRRRSSLGSAAMLGGLGSLGHRRRPALAGKMGLAGLGYMAYRAYNDHQARTSSQQTGNPSQQTGSAAAGQPRTASSGSGAGGIGGMVQDLIDKVGAAVSGSTAGSGSSSSASRPAAPSPAAQPTSAAHSSATPPSSATQPMTDDPAEPAPTEAELEEASRAADAISDDRALLLLRAMIAAAYADGSLSNEERERIMSHIAEAGGDDDDRRTMEREIADPRSLDDLLAEVRDHETAEEFYLASSAAIDGEAPANRSYLEALRKRLDLSTEEARQIDELTV